jgi:hypothetical protein
LKCCGEEIKCGELADDDSRLLMRAIATAAVITRELMAGLLFFDCVYLVRVSMAGHQNNTGASSVS